MKSHQLNRFPGITVVSTPPAPLREKGFFSKSQKQALLAVPAAALMLGASHAGTTVGINFSGDYYGYYAGAPVTATAFGVAASDWQSTPITGSSAARSGTMTVASMGVSWNATNTWTTNSDRSVPGDNEVTYGMLDNTGWTSGLSNLNAVFPSGYVVEFIGAGKTTTNSSVSITENTGSTLVGNVTFSLLPNANGLGASPVLTNDAITFTNISRNDPTNCALGGFIVTDKPVVSKKPIGASIANGGTISLSARAVGVPPMTYQWFRGTTPVSSIATEPTSATISATYTKSGAVVGDSGDYTLAVTNDHGTGTSVAAQVAVATPVTVTWDSDTGTNGAQDGGGTWNSTNANWWDGALDQAWSPLNPAVFGNGGTGAYTVLLGNSMTANAGLAFNSGTYTLNPTTSETLTLADVAEITTNANAIIGARLTGSSGFTKKGNSRLTLTNNGNSLTGAVVVNAGILDVSRGSGGTSLTVNSGATAITTASNAIGYGTNCYTLNVNGGTFSLGVSGDGIWDMNTTLNNATLTGVSGANWSFGGGGSQIANSGTSTITGGTLVLREGTPNNTLPITNSGNLTINCPITSSRNISFAGSGTTTLAGINTYTGSTTINDGTLVVSGQNGGSTTTVNAGTLEITGKVTNTGAVWFKDNTSLKVTANGSTPALSTPGTMTVGTDFNNPSGMNQLTFNALSSTSVAPVTVGTVFLDSQVTINIGSVIPLVGQYPLMKSTGSAGATAIPLTLGSLPSGVTAELVDDSAGPTQTIYLNVTAVTTPLNVWTGAESSIWDINTAANWTAEGTSATFQEGNVVQFDDSAGNTAVTLNTTVHPAVVTFNNPTKDYTLGGSGAIAGNTTLTKDGAGTLTVSNNNSYTGATTISGGKLVFQDSSTSALSGGIDNNAALEISTTSAPQSTATSIIGTGTLTKSGTNMLTLTGPNTYSGGTTIEGGILQIGDGTTNGKAPGAYAIATGSTLKLVYNSSGATAPTWSGITGSGTLVLKSAKNFDTGWGQASLGSGFTGTLRIEGGRVSTNGEGSLGGTTSVVITPGGHLGMWEGGTFPQQFTIAGTGYGEGGYEAALRLANGGKTTTLTGNVTLSANATLGSQGTGILSGVVSGGSDAALSLGTSSMSGTIELSGANDYTGATNVNRGRLVVSGTLGATAVTVANGATLDAGPNISGRQALGASLTVNSGGRLGFRIAATPAAQVTRTLTGPLNLTAGNIVDLLATNTPADGTYTLATASGITGTPGAGIALPLTAGHTATLSVSGNSLVLTIAGAGYDSWVSGFTWPVGADQTRSGDPDGDGFSNLQEFLFGTSPVAGNSSLTTTETSGGNLIIRWKQRVSGPAYALKESSTLANNWVTSSAPVSNDGAPTGDYQPKMATVVIGSNKNFFRLEGVEN